MGLTTAIGLGVAGIGSVLSSSSNRSAARDAADVSQQNNTQNTALARESRDMALERLDPFANRGNAAGNALADLYGVGGPTPVQPNALSQFAGQPQGPTPFGGAGAPYGLGDFGGIFARDDLSRPSYGAAGYGDGVPGNFGGTNALSRSFPENGLGYSTNPGIAAQTGVVQPTSEQQILSTGDRQNAAFDNFRKSTGYQFRLGEGMDALNSGWAGAGLLQSGAAARDALEYGQNFASNEFGNFANGLALLQSTGAGAASASAGVSQNFASQVTSNNNQNAANQANALLVRGNNNALGNAAGIIGGGLISGGFG